MSAEELLEPDTNGSSECSLNTSELNTRGLTMRFREIACRSHPTARQTQLSTVTLYVFEDEWDRLQTLLGEMGPTKITAVRPLCRFSGMSVDVYCQDGPNAASDLLGKWCNHTVRKLCQTAAAEGDQRAPIRRG